MPLIRDPALEWASGQLMTVRLSPLTLPGGRVLGDFSAFTLKVRSDPVWPRAGVTATADPDPIADGWPEAVTSTGGVVDGVVTFTFTMPAAAGVKRYAVDVWGALSAGGDVQLVRATWLTGGGRVV